jgi:hypothetical protein
MLGVTHNQHRLGIQPFTSGAISPKSGHLSVNHNQGTACCYRGEHARRERLNDRCLSYQRLWRWSPQHALHRHSFLTIVMRGEFQQPQPDISLVGKFWKAIAFLRRPETN